MDNKKFIQSKYFDVDLNKILYNENKTFKLQNKDNINNHIYNIENLDFFNFDLSNVKKHYKSIQSKINKNVILGGTLLRSIFDIEEKELIQEYTYSILNSNEKYDDIVIDGITYKFKENKNYNLCLYTLSNNNPIDRIVFYENKVFISHSFMIEIFKRTSMIDKNLKDPIFKKQKDIFEIRQKNKNEKSLVEMINYYDFKHIDEFVKNNKDEITKLFLYEKMLINPIEYVLILLSKEEHPILINQLRLILLTLKSNIEGSKLIRSPKILAYYFNIHDTYPALFDELEFDCIINSIMLPSFSLLNEKTIEQIIIMDNEDLFIEYLSKCNLILKFKTNSSKSIEFVIDMMILYKPKNIMKTLISLNIISNYYKYKIIFLSEQFEFFDQEKLDMILKNDNFKEDDIIIDDKDIILDFFEDIIKNHLVRSFYITIHLFKDIIEDNKELIFYIENEDIFQLLIEMKPELINSKKNNITLLMHYSKLGYEKHIIMLLENNVSYVEIDEEGNNFLHYLVRYNHSHILSKVCKYVIEIIDHQNDKLESPILLSTKLGFENIFFILKGNKANLELTDYFGNTVYHYICSNNICLNMIIPNVENKFNYTPKDYCNISHEFYYFMDKN